MIPHDHERQDLEELLTAMGDRPRAEQIAALQRLRSISDLSVGSSALFS